MRTKLRRSITVVALGAVTALALPLASAQAAGPAPAYWWSSDPGAGRPVVDEDSIVLDLVGAGRSASRYFGVEDVTDRAQQVGEGEISTSFTLDRMPTGNGTYLSVIALRQDDDTDYRAKIVVRPTGEIWASVVKRVQGTETILSSGVIQGVRYDESLPTVNVRVGFGSETYRSTSTILGFSTDVWAAGTKDPGDRREVYAADIIDQRHFPVGGVGVEAYASSQGVDSPSQVRFGRFAAVASHSDSYLFDSLGTGTGPGWEGDPRAGSSWVATPMTPAEGLSTEGGVGVMTWTAGSGTRAVYQDGVPVRNASLSFDATVPALPDGRGLYLSGALRSTAAGEYLGRLTVSQDGVGISIVRVSDGTEVSLAGTSVGTIGAGTTIRVQFEAYTDRAGTTHLGLTATPWGPGASPGKDTTVTATDATPSLSGPGHAGVQGYLSSSSTLREATVQFRNIGMRNPEACLATLPARAPASCVTPIA